jgi:hypothetical protein
MATRRSGPIGDCQTLFTCPMSQKDPRVLYLAPRLLYHSKFFSVLLLSTPSPILGTFCRTCVEVFMHTALLTATSLVYGYLVWSNLIFSTSYNFNPNTCQLCKFDPCDAHPPHPRRHICLCSVCSCYSSFTSCQNSSQAPCCRIASTSALPLSQC